MAGRYEYRPGGSNYLCLPEEPQWKNYTTAESRNLAHVFGVEYKFDRNFINGGRRLSDKPVPCAVCYVSQRSASLMIPAGSYCPVGWTEEYGGYVMSAHRIDAVDHSTSYVCVDQAPAAGNGRGGYEHALISVVKVVSGTLPSTVYHYRELACVVCTK